MNDAHDNTQADADMLSRIETDEAVQYFRAVMTKELQLEVAEYKLTKTMRGHLDLDRYMEETDEIRGQYETKRQGYRTRGMLPRN